eukprot:GHVU01208088.1.p1 GENE.GHVU01208088.1~~GHVU01208088.1.p1  ORF type:complete len:123 (-),score=16.40 GHVU01208088.1:222-590(-)
MVSGSDRRVSTIRVRFGKARSPIEGVLDSGAVNCWISSSAVWKLREAGESLTICAIPEDFEVDWQPPPEGILEVDAWISVDNHTWIEGGSIPFLVVQENFDFVLISERVLEIVSRFSIPRLG